MKEINQCIDFGTTLYILQTTIHVNEYSGQCIKEVPLIVFCPLLPAFFDVMMYANRNLEWNEIGTLSSGVFEGLESLREL